MGFEHVGGALALTFATWAVSIAGLASLQSYCEDEGSLVFATVPGTYSALHGCNKVLRFQWFVISLEFVTILLAGLALAGGQLRKARVAMVGLFAVVTVFYIQLTDQWMVARDFDYWKDGTDKAKSRSAAILAGALMTATANFITLIVLGLDLDGEAVPSGKGKSAGEEQV